MGFQSRGRKVGPTCGAAQGACHGSPQHDRGKSANDQYFKAAVNAAKTRTYRTAVRFKLSSADREDLYQALVLDLLERAAEFDPSKGSAGTFTGVLSEHRTADFLNGLKKDRSRLIFCSGDEAANDSDIPAAVDPYAEGVVPLWAFDRDLFADSMLLRDLEAALAYMTDEQQSLFALLHAHGDTASALQASGMASATFYRRVSDLRLHLRMFGIKAAA